MKQSLSFVPGQRLEISGNINGVEKEEIWEINTTPDNQTYIHCSSRESYAYYVNDGNLLYFTHFEGSKNSILYYFYLGFYKIISFFGIKSPFFMSFFFRLMTTIFGLFAIWRLRSLIKEWFDSSKEQLVAWGLLNLLLFVPYIQTRTSSESLSISFFFLMAHKGLGRNSNPPSRTGILKRNKEIYKNMRHVISC